MVLENPRELISVHDCWILINQVRIMFLPESCRGYVYALSGDKLAVGSYLGIITLLRFELNQLSLI